MTRLLLLRHGESTWNAQRRWQGQADPPLSSRGERQATAAARSLGQWAMFDRVVSSPLLRARRTAELIAAAADIPFGGLFAQLMERHAGPWQGLTRVEIEARFPGALANGERPDGYESDRSVVARALTAMGDLTSDRTAGTVLAVTHGGVIHALEDHVGAAGDAWQRLDNLEGRWFAIADGAWHAVGERQRLLPDDEAGAAAESGYA